MTQRSIRRAGTRRFGTCRICRRVGVYALFHEYPEATGASQYDWGIDPRFKQSYFDTYIKFDPMAAARFMFDVEQVYSTVDIVSYDEFLETRFYKEGGKPQGMIDMI